MTESALIRPVTEADLPLLTSWRRQAHVRRWWGPPESEPEAEKLRETTVVMWIAVIGERPFAFIQDYAIADWSFHHFDYLPSGSRGIDLYIGVGLGPHPDNARARRAFRCAGFVIAGAPLDTRWGRTAPMHQFA